MHAIMEDDYMFSAKKIVPWHGLGAVIDEAPTSEDALRIAKLDWSIIQEPLLFGTEKDGYSIVPDMYANVRSDTRKAVGIITKKYRVVQNTEAFAFVNDIMKQNDVPCRYETAGSLFNGKRVFLSVEMPESEVLGDITKNYLVFSNSHDGTSSCKACVSKTRPVCNNTVNAAFLNAPRVWSYRHVGDFEGRKKEAIETLGLASTYIEEFERFAEKLASKKVNIQKFVAQLLPINEDMTERIIQSTIATQNLIIDIAKRKDDLANFRGDGWGAFNAVADFVSNAEPKRQTDTFQRTRLLNFIDGSKMMEKAEKILIAA